MAEKTEEWRKNADTHRMTPEEVRAAGVKQSQRPPGSHPGEILHQRRKMPSNFAAVTISGILITAAIGYMVLHTKKKPEATVLDDPRASTAAGDVEPKYTHPRK